MAATVQIRVTYGPSASPTTETSDAADLNFLGADLGSGETPADHPVEIPPSGTNYSYERWFRAYVSDMGGMSKVKNFRVYANTTSPISGTTIKYGTTTTYATPKNTASSVATSDIPTSEPSENLYIGGSAGGEITSAGNYTDYGVIQLVVPSTASLAAGSATITFLWDEVA